MNIFALIFFSLWIILTAIAFKSFIKDTDTLEKWEKNRIIDLFVIGIIFFAVGIVIPENPTTPMPKLDSLGVVGSLIILYGFAILIHNKFKEGYHESSRDVNIINSKNKTTIMSDSQGQDKGLLKLRKVNINFEDLLIVMGLIILPFSMFLGQTLLGLKFAAILIPVPLLIRSIKRW